MNFSIFENKLYVVKLGKMIHHLELYQHHHHHELPSDMRLNDMKKTILMIDIKSVNKRESLRDIENDDIDSLIKHLKKLKNDVGMNYL